MEPSASNTRIEAEAGILKRGGIFRSPSLSFHFIHERVAYPQHHASRIDTEVHTNDNPM